MASRASLWFFAYVILDRHELRDTYLVLCLQATSKDGKDAGIELVQPPPDSKPGDRVFFEGPDFESTCPSAYHNDLC